MIGGGIGGMAVALRTAVQGAEVTLFEANDVLGGKIAEQYAAGFRFDMGPTILTIPQYIDELFELAGEDPRQYWNYQRLDPVFRYFFEDGTEIRTPANTDELVREFVAKTTVEERDLRAFLQRAKEKLEITDKVFLQRSLHQWRNYLDRPTRRGLLRFRRIEAFTSMARSNADLLKDPKVCAIMNQYASYNGSDPFVAPATLNLIAHYELRLGAYLPNGGMFSMVTALSRLMDRCGVQVRLNSRVERITVKNGRATGLVVADQQKEFDQVVSNADVLHTYQRLLPDVKRPKRVLDQPRSSSVIVFFWGMDRTFPELGLHNMFMSEDQRLEYRALFQDGVMPDDPTVYVNITSKMNYADASPGQENWFCMITVPHLTEEHKRRSVEVARERVLRKLQRMLGLNIERHIVHESVMDPNLIETRTGSAFGSVYGNSSNGIFAAFLRHPNFSSRVKDLYFCGGSVHPGSSVPLCLLSAKITAGLMEG